MTVLTQIRFQADNDAHFLNHGQYRKTRPFSPCHHLPISNRSVRMGISNNLSAFPSLQRTRSCFCHPVPCFNELRFIHSFHDRPASVTSYFVMHRWLDTTQNQFFRKSFIYRQKAHIRTAKRARFQFAHSSLLSAGTVGVSVGVSVGVTASDA